MTSGTLRINGLVEAKGALAPVVLEFLRRYPETWVGLVTEGWLVDIVAEGFGRGIRPGDLVPRDMIAVHLSPPKRHAVVAPSARLVTHPTSHSPAGLDAEHFLRPDAGNGGGGHVTKHRRICPMTKSAQSCLSAH